MPNDFPHYYLIYDNINIFQQVLDLIKVTANKEECVDWMFNIIIVPKIVNEFYNLLEMYGLYSQVTLHHYQWFPISLDKSLLTLEFPDIYRELFLFNDLTHLSVYAKSMWQLFFVIGKPRFTITIGRYSNMVMEQLNKITTLMGTSNKEPCVDGMVVFDRSVDYVSALLTPATYTALLNEVCDLNCNTYSMQQSKEMYDAKYNVIPKVNSNTFTLDTLNDNIYREIKHQHFSVVTHMLSKLTKKLKTKGENITKEWNIQDGKNFVSNELKDILSMKQKVNNHLQASETIVNVLGTRFERQKEVEENIILNNSKSNNYKYLEEILTAESNKKISLRLMCLMALTQKLSNSEINNFCSKYFLENGYSYGFLYNNLKRASFAEKVKDGTSKFLNIPKLTASFYHNATKFKQIPKDSSKIELKSPNCCSYVFTGLYIPFVATMASMLINAAPLKELQTKLEAFSDVSFDNIDNYSMKNRSLIVYVIGGITYAEVAACNLLEKMTDSQIILVSDKVISGNCIMDAILKEY